MEEKTFSLDIGVHQLDLGFLLTKDQGDWTLHGDGINLWRNNVGVSYPYVSGSFTIVDSSAGASYFYYFYDMHIHGVSVEGKIAQNVSLENNKVLGLGSLATKNEVDDGNLSNNLSTEIGKIPTLETKTANLDNDGKLEASFLKGEISDSNIDSVTAGQLATKNKAGRFDVEITDAGDTLDAVIEGQAGVHLDANKLGSKDLGWDGEWQGKITNLSPTGYLEANFVREAGDKSEPLDEVIADLSNAVSNLDTRVTNLEDGETTQYGAVSLFKDVPPEWDDDQIWLHGDSDEVAEGSTVYIGTTDEGGPYYVGDDKPVFVRWHQLTSYDINDIDVYSKETSFTMPTQSRGTASVEFEAEWMTVEGEEL